MNGKVPRWSLGLLVNLDDIQQFVIVQTIARNDTEAIGIYLRRTIPFACQRSRHLIWVETQAGRIHRLTGIRRSDSITDSMQINVKPLVPMIGLDVYRSADGITHSNDARTSSGRLVVDAAHDAFATGQHHCPQH